MTNRQYFYRGWRVLMIGILALFIEKALFGSQYSLPISVIGMGMFLYGVTKQIRKVNKEFRDKYKHLK